MSTTPFTTNTLPSSIPKLDPQGENWAIFAICFETAMQAKGKWGHFDGTAPEPSLVATPTAEQRATLAEWLKDKHTSLYLLIQQIPDSTVVCVQKLTTVAQQWAAIVSEYTLKGAYAQTELQRSFMEMRCDNNADVRQFLDDLRTKQEELVACGVNITT